MKDVSAFAMDTTCQAQPACANLGLACCKTAQGCCPSTGPKLWCCQSSATSAKAATTAPVAAAVVTDAPTTTPLVVDTTATATTATTTLQVATPTTAASAVPVNASAIKDYLIDRSAGANLTQIAKSKTNGTCAFYSNSTCTRPRGCADCLNLITSGQNCVIEPTGLCIDPGTYDATLDFSRANAANISLQQQYYYAATQVSYCSANDSYCKECKTAWTNSSSTSPLAKLPFCRGEDGCVCIRLCEIDDAPSKAGTCYVTPQSVAQDSDSSGGVSSTMFIAGAIILAVACALWALMSVTSARKKNQKKPPQPPQSPQSPQVPRDTSRQRPTFFRSHFESPGTPHSHGSSHSSDGESPTWWQLWRQRNGTTMRQFDISTPPLEYDLKIIEQAGFCRRETSSDDGAVEFGDSHASYLL